MSTESAATEQLSLARQVGPLDPEQLDLIVHSSSVPVRVQAARRHDLTFEQGLTLAADPSAEVRLAALGNAVVPLPEPTEAIISSGDRRTRRNLAQRADLESSDIGQLLADPDPVVREMLATNPILDREWLVALLDDEAWHVRAGLTSRLADHPRLADHLIADADWSVRAALAAAADASSINVSPLSADESPIVRKSLAGNPTIVPSQLIPLATDPAATVRTVVAGRADLSHDLLLALAGDREDEVRLAIARNRAVLPDDALLHLVGDSSHEVRRATAMRSQRFSTDVLQRLADQDLDLLAYREENLTPEQFERLAGSDSRRIRAQAAAHPHLPHAVLERLAVDEAAAVRRAVARRVDLPAALETRVAQDADRSVRRIVERRRAEQ